MRRDSRPPRAGRIALTSIIVLVTTWGLAACSPPGVACPAIGWINELTVTLDGNVAPVADVKLCIDEACVPMATGTPPEELAQVGLATQNGTTDEWVFTTGMSTPERFSVRVYNANGEVLADRDVTAEWVRVGGSEACGGPGEATVTVQL